MMWHGDARHASCTVKQLCPGALRGRLTAPPACMCAQVKQAAQQVGEQAEPIAKDITRGVIQPGAKLVAENAVPVTEQARIRI